MTIGNKYLNLKKYLINNGKNHISLNFDTIEDILGFNLPHSARKYSVWWANNNSHSQAIGWLDAGYKVIHIETDLENVVFNKNNIAPISRQNTYKEPIFNNNENNQPERNSDTDIVLISCTKYKNNYRCTTEMMYAKSNLFDSSLAYARTLVDDNHIFIISAKYHLLKLTDVIDTYDETLKDVSPFEKDIWAKEVYVQLSNIFDMRNTRVTVLAGKDYYQPLRPYIKNLNLPLLGMPLGERISKMKEWAGIKKQVDDDTVVMTNKNTCLKLHKMFNMLPRYNSDSIEDVPFDNGIYIIFEKGEKYKDLDRIVRVGTHRTDDRLKGRLGDHFIKENKDGSIFRKNIGRTILNENSDIFLEKWEKEEYYPSERNNQIEKEVTHYMKKNFTFTCIKVDDKDKRLRLEDGIISSLNNDDSFKATANWFGNHHPYPTVKQCGMWLAQGLNADVLSKSELQYIKDTVFKLLEYYINKDDLQEQIIVESAQQKPDFKIASDVNPNEYTIIDIETTGFSPNNCHIIEIGAIKVLNYEVVAKFNELVTPPISIPQHITKITGITNELISLHGKSIHETIKAFDDFIGDSILVGHNIGFDLRFLNEAYKTILNKEIDNFYVDTLKEVRNKYPEIPSKKLKDLANYFGIDSKNNHRAIKDCLITKEVYDICNLRSLKKTKINNVHKTQQLQKLKCTKPTDELTPITKYESSGQTKTEDIVSYLKNQFAEAKRGGQNSIVIKSGDIHNELELQNKMPMVCSAMRKLKNDIDIIHEEPTKGNGSRLYIEYFL